MTKFKTIILCALCVFNYRCLLLETEDTAAGQAFDISIDTTIDTIINTIIDTTIDTVSDTIIDTTSDTTIDTIIDITIDTIIDTTSDTTVETTSDTIIDTTIDSTIDTTTDTPPEFANIKFCDHSEMKIKRLPENIYKIFTELQQIESHYTEKCETDCEIEIRDRNLDSTINCDGDNCEWIYTMVQDTINHCNETCRTIEHPQYDSVYSLGYIETQIEHCMGYSALDAENDTMTINFKIETHEKLYPGPTPAIDSIWGDLFFTSGDNKKTYFRFYPWKSNYNIQLNQKNGLAGDSTTLSLNGFPGGESNMSIEDFKAYLVSDWIGFAFHRRSTETFSPDIQGNWKTISYVKKSEYKTFSYSEDNISIFRKIERQVIWEEPYANEFDIRFGELPFSGGHATLKKISEDILEIQMNYMASVRETIIFLGYYHRKN